VIQPDSATGWVDQSLGGPSSVCTGSLVYAAAGLLPHCPATTHWGSLDRLAELDPTIDARFVDDGDVVTSAVISVGIDVALHLVARLAGTDRARQVRRGIQYDPATPSERLGVRGVPPAVPLAT